MKNAYTLMKFVTYYKILNKKAEIIYVQPFVRRIGYIHENYNIMNLYWRNDYGILDFYVSYEFTDTIYYDRIWTFVSQ